MWEQLGSAAVWAVFAASAYACIVGPMFQEVGGSLSHMPRVQTSLAVVVMAGLLIVAVVAGAHGWNKRAGADLAPPSTPLTVNCQLKN